MFSAPCQSKDNVSETFYGSIRIGFKRILNPYYNNSEPFHKRTKMLIYYQTRSHACMKVFSFIVIESKKRAEYLVATASLHKFSSFSLEYEQKKTERVQRDFLYMKY